MDYEFPIAYAGSPVGTAKFTPDGLYWRASLRARVPSGAVLRGGVMLRGTARTLGVLLPQPDGSIAGQWRVPASRFSPEQITDAFLTGDENVWQPWQGTIQGYACRNALSRMAGACKEVAIAYEPETPLEMVPLFCFFHPTKINGKTYFVIRLDGDGWPIL
ncbi:MAG: hypothetical protein PHS97_00245 [Oscillospiraceae bacterium]|nr:hypothetical protein [Oscillospiraceae bacterium]